MIALSVQGDDFGMCHAVNEGIATAFTEGVLTHASVMAPCPWFAEAAALAARHGIPVGVHLTLTCDWTWYRWRPLTKAPSLCEADGTFHRTVAAAREAIDQDEALAELVAQVELVRAAGLRPRYFDPHMGRVSARAYTEICRRFGAPFIYPMVEPSAGFDSIEGLSERGPGKRDWLLGWLEGLADGRHLLVCHPGVAGPELAAVDAPDSPVYAWAEEYRASDLAALVDPEVRAVVERRGIALVPAGAA